MKDFRGSSKLRNQIFGGEQNHDQKKSRKIIACISNGISSFSFPIQANWYFYQKIKISLFFVKWVSSQLSKFPQNSHLFNFPILPCLSFEFIKYVWIFGNLSKFCVETTFLWNIFFITQISSQRKILREMVRIWVYRESLFRNSSAGDLEMFVKFPKTMKNAG